VTELHLEPMTEERYKVFREYAVADYAEQMTQSGMSPEDAAQEATESHNKLLPEGLASVGQFLFTAGDGDEEVGMIWLAITPGSDGPQAYVYDVVVWPEFRRHGHGRAIMLAAEQVCRERGVVAIGLNVFGFNVGARRLYEQLGFETSATTMIKPLGKQDQEQIPEPGVRLEPMTEEQYAAYLPFAQQDYARNIAQSGAMSEADATEQAAAAFARLHSERLAGPGQLLFTAYDGETEVGMVGLRLREKWDGPHAFAFDFRVVPERRRQGHGRAIMVAAEQVCRDRGVVSVELSVFGFNKGAQSLYEQMGFDVKALRMTKHL
jgi:ribosomal protein S18 acetylase RimI-like enzyme